MMRLTSTAAPACHPVRYEVEVVNTWDRFLALEPTWTALLRQSGLDHPFVSYDWVKTWWESFGQNHRLHVVIVRDQSGRVAAIAPLMWSYGWMYGMPVRRLQSMTNAHSPRYDFLIRRSNEDVFRAIWDHLARTSARWDVLQLEELAAGSRAALEIPEYAAEAGFLSGHWSSGESPYVSIGGTFASYLAGLDAKHRSNLRNRFKRLGALGTVRFETVECPEGLADGLRLEAAAWKGKAGTAMRSAERVHTFYSTLADRAAASGCLRLQFLTVDEQRIAFHYVIQFGQRQFLLKPGYDPRFAAYSPSNLLCARALEDAFARGLTEHDFLGEAEDWKLRWTSSTRPHEWLFVFPNTPRGRFLHRLKFQTLPTIRQQPLFQVARTLLMMTGFHG